ncbi:MAG: hypothetical protein GY810_05410 [Aureispira sp.]|nr:hypothetical protein [Aureispira sp.]
MEILDDHITTNGYYECRGLLLKNIGLGLLGVVSMLFMPLMIGYKCVVDYGWMDWHWGFRLLTILVLGFVLWVLGLIFLLFVDAVRDMLSKKVLVNQATVRAKKINDTRKGLVYLLAFREQQGKNEFHSVNKVKFEGLLIGDEVHVYLGSFSEQFLKIEKVDAST